VAIDARQAQRLCDFAHLLLKWSAVHNLTAIRAAERVATHHLLDSLAVVPHLRRIGGRSALRVLDVGSGGGLPGIPIAIALPDLDVTLLDANRKKCAFLTQARVDLGISNLSVVHARVEQWQGPRFDIIVSRAFSSLREFVEFTRHLIAADGAWLAMKGCAALRELVAPPPATTVSEVVELAVPGLDAERSIVVLRPA
jgi:16S rRNA (guanine527-N7)-methyltransferase